MDTSLSRDPKRSMTDEERVRDFQRKIYLKAKQERKFRFYSLYDKVHLLHFLAEAYRRVKANKGSPGVDGVTFTRVEETGRGLLGFLLDLQVELQEETYRPMPVKRVMIPKANGKMRPLGIPTIRDRVVQMSCKMVIEPIFEADFEDESYGFRPKRDAKQAMARIQSNLKAGNTAVYDADLSAYFDTIPHEKLLKLVALRISDGRILHLIKLWLKAPVMEDGRMSGGKGNKVGTPQGGVISPLLANIYLHLLDKLVKKGRFGGGITIVRYADDFVLMGKQLAEESLQGVKALFDRMGLKVNEEKTRLIDARTEPFDFLGHTVRYCRSRFANSGNYWRITPSKKSGLKVVEKARDYLGKNGHRGSKVVVRELNAMLRGWLAYFTNPGVTDSTHARIGLRMFLRDRLFRFKRRKSQRHRHAHCRGTFKRWVEKYGLIDPETYGVPGLAKA